MSSQLARVTVVVVTWQGAARIQACLSAVLGQEPAAAFEVLVVDNASTDGTADLLAGRYPQVRLVRAPRNLGFAGGNALALAEVTTEYVALVNDDAEPAPGWLAALVEHLDADPRCGAVTGKVLLAAERDGRAVVNSAGGTVDRLGRGADRGHLQLDEGQFDAPTEVFYAPATACLLRREAVEQVGGFDPGYFLYHEDVDLCWRLRLGGWGVAYTPAAVARHAHGASSGATSASPLHAFHDTRNRLLTVVKDAPALPAAAVCARLPLTTASTAVRGLLARGPERRRQLALAAVLARALASVLGRLPALLAARREVGRRARVSRGSVDRDRARLARTP